MASVFENMEPKLLWEHFDAIRKIPRCSKEEAPAGDYVISIAEKNGLKHKRDDTGNVMIEVPASPGHENAPVVVLQGHLDMVCEKNSDVTFDFSKDPIDVKSDGEWLTANGTTLGADNGIGISTALALIEDKSVVHGPLELLFTTDEETGLNGANGLQSDFLKGRILLNLDSEEEGAFSIGCAGGGDSEILMPIKRKGNGSGTELKVMLSGLRGGHSGIDIHTGRGNAIQLLARMLYKLDAEFDLVLLEGGSKHNAIPREAFAHVITADEAAFKKAVQSRFEEIQFEYKAVEKEMKLLMDTAPQKGPIPMDDATKISFLGLLFGLPHGVMAMSQEIKGLVETSNNLAIVKVKETEATIYTSTRSSIQSALEAVRIKIEAIAVLAGAKVTHLDGYPPWTPNLDSKLLKTMQSVYKRLYNKDPRVEAIHAGLECGIIGEKFSGMDMISFGPDLQNPHSPDERVHIKSVGRFWDLVVATLKELV